MKTKFSNAKNFMDNVAKEACIFICKTYDKNMTEEIISHKDELEEATRNFFEAICAMANIEKIEED